MDKNIEDNNNHLINIIGRKNIVLTGIKKINTFDDEEFYVDSIMGKIIIKGEKLELIKMDTFQGNLSIKGKIIAINYLEDKSIKAENIISRLFK